MKRKDIRQMTRREAYEYIVANYRGSIAEFEQLIRDQQWWNQNRLDAEPFDLGQDLVMKAKLEKELAAFIRQNEGTF
jgi:hypothetical protein